MKDLLTSKEFWIQYAPCFNFEFDEKQLIRKGLERGFITKVIKDGETLYEVNPDY